MTSLNIFYIRVTKKLANEIHTKASYLQNKEIITKQLNKLRSDNIHFKRNLEKNKLFKENYEEKLKSAQEKNEERFNEIDKKVLQLALDYDEALRKIENNSKQKQIENENNLLINNINK